ncbi:putative tspA protein [Neisseria meningitidis 63049]|nr:putative tspA protein [Neisseria meningitidis 63049]
MIALLLLLRLAQSKRARRTEESVPEEEPDLDDAADDGIEITFAEVETPATPEPAPKNDVNDTLALDGESEEELSAKQTFDVETDTPSNRIDLDFDSLAAAQNGILSGALTQDEETQKRADADWNAIESTDSVYEPETFNPYNPVEIVIDTPEPESVAQTAENKPETVDTDFSDNLPSNNHIGTEETASAKPASPSGLAGFLKASSPETILEKTVAEVQTPEELHDFLKVYETDAVAETAPETPDFNAAADDLSALLQPAEAPSVEENVTKTVAEIPDFNATADDLSALLQPSEVPAVEENAAETVADDLSALLQPAEAPAVEENAAEITLETPDSNTSEADALPDFLKDGEEETVDWSIYLSEENIPNNADTSFPSESVGSDAPSEAKYDLAEMYLEIGDRDAAAETVQKLLEEAEGDVLKRAQALAQELGI